MVQLDLYLASRVRQHNEAKLHNAIARATWVSWKRGPILQL